MNARRGRQRRQKRRDARQGIETPTGPTRYQMRERLVAFGNDYVIKTAGGVPAYRVDGKALRLRNTIRILDQRGRLLYRVQARVLRLKQTMAIDRDGQTVATVQKALVTPFRDRFDVDVVGGPPLHVQGNILDHEYRITRNGAPVATVSKRWIRVRDTYGVEVMPGEDHAFVLAVVAAIDSI
ncbi:LURP-one-related/scramblase family protein [Halobaculum limi]|uniref:LURP-one-related/scramblase family protein n=1 Tax=Halobaculum limi TaxID=3031916 RepID=UPI0024064397|nr:LURP-one-related family protein [Halobaculum sp. YSMS11]